MERLPLTDQQIASALSVQATAAGAAELLSRWLERTVSAAEVIQAITASPRLGRVAAFCAESQGRAPVVNAEERIRAMAGPRRWRDRRARK
jgi:hypothetical protein